MIYINWKNGTERFLFKSNAEKFIAALTNRGHKIKSDFHSIDGSRYVTFA